MKKPTPEMQQMQKELQFAQQQVQAGKSALRNPDIDPDVATRVTRAVAYWDQQAQNLQHEIDMVVSVDGQSKQSKR